jgi:hypothetical protein
MPIVGLVRKWQLGLLVSRPVPGGLLGQRLLSGPRPRWAHAQRQAGAQARSGWLVVTALAPVTWRDRGGEGSH